MNCKFLLLAMVYVSLQFTSHTVQAQSKEELQELLNSESTTTKKGKEKPKKEEKAKPAKKQEEPKNEPAKAEEPKKESKSEPARAEQKKEEPQPQAENSNGDKLKELPDPQSISWGKNQKIGKKLFAQGSYFNGLRYYEAAASKKPGKIILHQNLADGYFNVRDFKVANKNYAIIVALDSVKRKNLVSMYYLALTDKYLGNYEQAKETFNRFSKLAQDNPTLAEFKKDAGREAEGCDYGIAQRNNDELRKLKVTLLNENINQPLTEYSPALKDDNTLYYGAWTSDRVKLENKKEKYADYSKIYSAKRNGKSWNKSEQVKGEVNEVKAHTGNSAFSKDGNTMYYTQCTQLDNQQMRCDIYKSSYSSYSGWNEGVKLDAVNIDGFTTTHPALGKNEAGEDVLYFASNRNVDKKMDIFYAKVNANGSIEKPKAVTGINTRGNETTPFYDFKTNTLYFSSDGRVNMGGLDVYKTSATSGQWSEPENMGTPVNSSVDDMYFMWNDYSALGFVVSNRPGGFSQKSETCCDDIFQVELNKIYLAVKGMITDADSNKTIKNGMVTLYDEATGKELKSFYAVDGSYLFDLETGNNYKVTSRKKDYEDLSKSLSMVDKRTNDTVTLDFALKGIPKPATAVGQRIGIVYWEFNKDNLTQTAPDTLNTVVSFMNNNPQYVLEVGSHTDSKGSDEYNLKLSQRRSDAVLRYLLSKKVAKYRLESKAYGESQPAALNEDPAGTDNPDGRTQNRRTEFKVVNELSPAEQQQKEEEEVKAKKKIVKKATAVQSK